MSTTTTRNSLVKPGYADAADIAVINTNYDTIDASFAKCNWAGTTFPAITDDSGDGYAIGSFWFDTTNHKLYIAETVGLGSATWRQVYPETYQGDLKANGTVPLTADWDVGAYHITADHFVSDVAIGTAPFSSTSTTVCTNVNADQLDGLHDTGYVKQTLADAKGDLIVASADDTWARQAVGTNGHPLRAYSGATNGVGYYPERTGLLANAIINGGFQICQTGVTTVTSATTPANTDDTYITDMWTLLSDGNDIVDAYVNSAGSASTCMHYTHMKLEVETQNKKFGIIQFIENKWAQHFTGKYVSLQFKAATTAGKAITNVRAAVLSWSSTSDTVTSDVVATWENSGTNPTLAANWTYENVAANLALVPDAWTKYTVENIYIDTASMANLAVFIWVDDTDAAVDDVLYITDVQLNEGAIALPTSVREFDDDRLLCQRFWEASYTYGIAPGASNIAPGLTHMWAQSTATAWFIGMCTFRVPKRIAVTPKLYSYAGTADKITDTLTNDVGTTVTSGGTDQRGIRTCADSGSGLTSGNLYRSHWVADVRL
jgi:hypothetical protein